MPLLGARIDGSIDLTGAHLADVKGVALGVDDAVIRGSVYLIGRQGGRDLRADGAILLNSAQVAGRVIVRDATVTASDRSPGRNYADHGVRGSAIGASRLSVGGDLLFEGACRLDGRVDLPLATLGRLTAGPDCRFDAPGNTALDLTNAELGSHLRMAAGGRVRGTLRLTGAVIHGVLSLKELRVSDRDGCCGCSLSSSSQSRSPCNSPKPGSPSALPTRPAACTPRAAGSSPWPRRTG